MQNLRPHHSNTSNEFSPRVGWTIDDEMIHFKFEMQGSSQINGNPKFSTNYLDNPDKNWGLWEHDVFEVFISKDGESYLEVQISPLGQNFVLKIKKPRKVFESPASFSGKTETISTKPWHCLISIPFSDIPGSSKSLTGNCFCVVGEAKREFYALNINSEKDPDFHRPELFINFGEI